MKLNVTFSESKQSFTPNFGKVYDVSDGGFERGFAEGYANGYENGRNSIPDHLALTLTNTIEEYSSEDVTSLRENAFRNCTSLKRIVLPKCERAYNYTFMDCSKLEEINFPKLTSFGSYFCYRCVPLIKVNIPMVSNVNAYSFQGCASLERIELPSATLLGNGCFNGCQALKTIIISNKRVCTLGHVNALEGTPIEGGSGYVYVPADFVDKYKVATNWSTYANQIRAIEDYPDICNN